MSLQLIAKQMEAKGRKGDSMLVHMTPGEVAGLQKLAESAGGSLSVNPETGLVEANFLKRMLPTLVGLGVGAATMNPFAGAAAGAAVGGYQAKRNDQDVGMGALMGGLGGYGGASLGMGLGAAGGTAAASTTGASTAAGSGITGGAAPVANMTPTAIAPAPTGSLTADMITGYNPNAVVPDMTMSTVPPPDLATQYGMNTGAAQPATYSENLSQAGRGFGQMATKEGRTEFAKEFGMTEAGAGIAPLMAPGKKPGEAPVDDEMYVYDFDYGRTGADSTPTGSSAERTYFQPTYSNRRKIKAEDYLNAAEGGLMSLAEGGSTAAPSQGMTGGSAAAFDYLMGAAPSSAGLPSMAMQAPATQAPIADSGKMYTFNPATGAFARNPNFVDPAVAAQAAKDAAAAADAAAEIERQRNSGGGNAAGGLLGLAKGGMKSGGFVVPADVVSMIGEGNTDAGYKRIKSMVPGATAIKGKDGGQADTVKTSIEGKQPARVAHGEMYIPPETVKRMGGAKKLYAMMDRVRQQATGSKKQIKPVNLRRAMA
jgi:hypothetical protein